MRYAKKRNPKVGALFDVGSELGRAGVTLHLFDADLDERLSEDEAAAFHFFRRAASRDRDRVLVVDAERIAGPVGELLRAAPFRATGAVFAAAVAFRALAAPEPALGLQAWLHWVLKSEHGLPSIPASPIFELLEHHAAVAAACGTGGAIPFRCFVLLWASAAGKTMARSSP